MKKINEGIVFSDDIKRIFEGYNAFDFKYNYMPPKGVIDDVRADFLNDVNKIFENKVSIISEDEMLEVNNLTSSEYPHCIS